ncbi:MAG: DUF2946 family protein [Pseudomonadota bacterium]
MDDIVKQAMAKWPSVPACYGWLGLDARGRWYLRDEAAQAAGPFPQSRGALLTHEKLIEFIHRNYEPDEAGQWFFQNGPQRVFVELECAPLVWRVADDFSVVAHTGRAAVVRECVLDESGRLYLACDMGACRALGVESEKAPRRGQFLPDSPPHSGTMGQEAGKKWAAAAHSQPTMPNPDRLLGFGIVHSLDIVQAAQAVELGLWTPQALRQAELPARYGYVLSPLARHLQAGPQRG